MPKSLANAGFSALFWFYGYFWMFISPMAQVVDSAEDAHGAGVAHIGCLLGKLRRVFLHAVFYPGADHGVDAAGQEDE